MFLPPDPRWVSTSGQLEVNQGAAAPCTPALGCRFIKCPYRKYVHVGKMSLSEIWYAYALVGKMVIGNVVVENIVAGKNSWYQHFGISSKIVKSTN